MRGREGVRGGKVKGAGVGEGVGNVFDMKKKFKKYKLKFKKMRLHTKMKFQFHIANIFQNKS